ncbi:MAG: hypothetical protein RL097_202, partial [Candidatus Parcubacteria bacterium]
MFPYSEESSVTPSSISEVTISVTGSVLLAIWSVLEAISSLEVAVV